MARALFVREEVHLSDAIEQKLLTFARSSGLQTGDTLVVAAFRITADPGYVFDLRDPADPAYQLNLTLLADRVEATNLVVDLSGDQGTGVAATGGGGRVAQVYGRQLAPGLAVRADGGKGGVGADGQPGDDGYYTMSEDPRGKPVFEYEPPKPGGQGGPGGAGGPGGTTSLFWSGGAVPVASASAGAGGDGGHGGHGGRGPIDPHGNKRPDATDGQDGPAGLRGLAGNVSAAQLDGPDFWSAVRAVLGEDLLASARHWLATAAYRYRQVHGGPTPAEADTVLGLLDLVTWAFPGQPDAVRLRAQFLDGDTVLGLSRNVDVLPDFERMQATLDSYHAWIDPLFADAKDLLLSSNTSAFDQAQLAAQLRTFEANRRLLRFSALDAEEDVAGAQRELDGARALWSAAAAEVERRRDALQAPIDWGGIVVVGLFKVVGFVLSLYEPTAGKLVSSVPDYLVLGNTALTVSDAEISVLTKAIDSGATAASGLKRLVTAQGEVTWASVANDAGQAVISFAQFAKDLDSAGGDEDLKKLVKELTYRLQEVLAARGRLASAIRRAALATQREAVAAADQARYATLLAQATQNTSVLRETAQTLLGLVRQHGDTMLREKFRAARAVEIYRLTDESATMAADRWHLHPDVELDYLQGFLDGAGYVSRLLLTDGDLSLAQLRADFDRAASPDVQLVTHYVTIDDPTRLAQFRQQLSATFEVLPEDLVGDRFSAKVVKAAVTLDGVTAATPSFPVSLAHGGRCTYLRPDGTTVSQILQPRFELVEVATTGAAGTAVGAVAVDDDHIQHFWRRAVATQWRVAIEPAVVNEEMVDLTGLSAIRVALRYEAVTKQP
ncbi:MAG TPA: hypothetical protein VFJ97_03470 [Dermatophilaceae bacterium]|nr:hypothetical protein [Dermatophilaceae bacterium]